MRSRNLRRFWWIWMLLGFLVLVINKIYFGGAILHIDVASPPSLTKGIFYGIASLFGLIGVANLFLVKIKNPDKSG